MCFTYKATENAEIQTGLVTTKLSCSSLSCHKVIEKFKMWLLTMFGFEYWEMTQYEEEKRGKLTKKYHVGKSFVKESMEIIRKKKIMRDELNERLKSLRLENKDTLAKFMSDFTLTDNNEQSHFPAVPDKSGKTQLLSIEEDATKGNERDMKKFLEGMVTFFQGQFPGFTVAFIEVSPVLKN